MRSVCGWLVLHPAESTGNDTIVNAQDALGAAERYGRFWLGCPAAVPKHEPQVGEGDNSHLHVCRLLPAGVQDLVRQNSSVDAGDAGRHSNLSYKAHWMTLSMTSTDAGVCSLVLGARRRVT